MSENKKGADPFENAPQANQTGADSTSERGLYLPLARAQLASAVKPAKFRSKNKRPKHSTAASPLVTLEHGEAWTTSLHVAKKFGRAHKTVLRAIEKMECSDEFNRRNFVPINYLDDRGREQPMYRISRDGFSFLAMGFTGRAAAEWKERFILAFNRMERELRRIIVNRALPDWNEARQTGKLDRRELTDAVQLLCERAHERRDSTTSFDCWIMSATRVITLTLFENEFRESIKGIRDRLTAPQLRRLAMAEQVYADAVLSCLDLDRHHKAINEQAKSCVQAFAAATGGREVPGIDRREVRALQGQSGFIRPELVGTLALVAGPTAVAIAALVRFFGWA